MNLFKEDNGNASTMRIMVWLTVLSGLVIGIVSAVLNTLNTNTVALSLGLVSLGITGKTVQKKLEK